MSQRLALLKIEQGSRPEIGTIEGDEVILGREPTKGITIASDSVSRQHGIFTSQRNHWFYSDLGSTNGSWLNGKKVEKGCPKLIKAGDILQLADVGLEIQSKDDSQGIAVRSLIVFSRGVFHDEYPVPEFGRALVVGGSKADIRLDVDIYELPSLVVERRGNSICAYSIAKEVPVLINGATLDRTVTLADRDELEITHYRIILNEVPESEVARSIASSEVPGESISKIPYDNDEDKSQEDSFEELDPVRSMRNARANVNTVFGRKFDDEGDLDGTVSLTPAELKSRLAGYDMHPSMRHLQPQEQAPRYSFESLENKIMLVIGLVMFTIIASLIIWWLLPQ